MTQASHSLLQALRDDALAIRRNFLRMHFEAQAGHIGTGLSSIDLLTAIYKSWIGPADRFVLSKGHGASALYATLHFYGVFSDETIRTYYQDGTQLPAHPAPNAFAAIPIATGSLGHGLPVACGLAFVRKKLRGLGGGAERVACLMSDGECNEGSVWEAALFAGHHGLDNLTVLIDANGLQGFGRTSEVMNNEPFADKWRAFGFAVEEIDGHDFAQIHAALGRAPDGRHPRCILARTIKGKGVSFMEDRMEWHYLPMKPEQYQEALRALESGGGAK